MKTTLVTSLFVIGVVLAPVAAHAEGDADRSHPGTFVKDSIITSKIKTKLAGEKMNTLVHVSVDTDARGMVMLSGHVRSRELADRAGSIARATEGVTSVNNEIRVTAGD